MVESAMKVRTVAGIVPEREDVGHRVLADVAARLGDDEKHGDVGHEPADGVHESVVAVSDMSPAMPRNDAAER
jgi:hypothetical protein